MSDDGSDEDTKFAERAMHKLKARHQFINATTGLLGATVEIKLEFLIAALMRKKAYAKETRQVLMVLARQLTNIDMVRLLVEQDICQIRLKTMNTGSPLTPPTTPGATAVATLGPGQEMMAPITPPATPKARKSKEVTVRSGTTSTLVRNVQLGFVANADRAEALGFARNYVSDHVLTLSSQYGEGAFQGVFSKEVPFTFLTNLVYINRRDRLAEAARLVDQVESAMEISKLREQNADLMQQMQVQTKVVMKSTRKQRVKEAKDMLKINNLFGSGELRDSGSRKLVKPVHPYFYRDNLDKTDSFTYLHRNLLAYYPNDVDYLFYENTELIDDPAFKKTDRIVVTTDSGAVPMQQAVPQIRVGVGTPKRAVWVKQKEYMELKQSRTAFELPLVQDLEEYEAEKLACGMSTPLAYPNSKNKQFLDLFTAVPGALPGYHKLERKMAITCSDLGFDVQWAAMLAGIEDELKCDEIDVDVIQDLVDGMKIMVQSRLARKTMSYQVTWERALDPIFKRSQNKALRAPFRQKDEEQGAAVFGTTEAAALSANTPLKAAVTALASQVKKAVAADITIKARIEKERKAAEKKKKDKKAARKRRRKNQGGGGGSGQHYSYNEARDDAQPGGTAFTSNCGVAFYF